jgi:hypothetical protein
MSSFDADEWTVEIEQMTLMMRHAEGAPMWIEIRRQLRDQDVDPATALLVESYEEAAEEVGVVVALGPRVLLYRARTGDWTWTDVTNAWESSAFADQVQVGLRMLG